MRSLFLIILGFLFILQQTSQIAAMEPLEREDRRSLLATIFMSWAEDKKLDGTEIQKTREQINSSANTDKAVTTVINKMIEQGGSPNDIDEIILGNGFAIPRSAKVDYGVHDIFFGRSSLYGSLKSHAEAIRCRGISK